MKKCIGTLAKASSIHECHQMKGILDYIKFNNFPYSRNCQPLIFIMALLNFQEEIEYAEFAMLIVYIKALPLLGILVLLVKILAQPLSSCVPIHVQIS